VEQEITYELITRACTTAQEMFLFICTQIDDYFQHHREPSKVRN
jgi:hypothetical protein